METRSAKGKKNWLAGLATSAAEFKSAWPKKVMTAKDARLLALAARKHLTPEESAELWPLIAERQERNER